MSQSTPYSQYDHEQDIGRINKENLEVTRNGLLWWSLISLAFVLFGAIGSALNEDCAEARFSRFLDVFTSSALLAAAAFSIGALLGFIFGIPRTLQQINPESVESRNNVSSATNYRQGVNTNLEQISDWLTKILVGVGLTQLTDIPKNIWILGSTFSVSNNIPFTVALILNFLICGFFFGYLMTRLFLAGAFNAADNQNGKTFVERIEKGNIFNQSGEFSKAAAEYVAALKEIGPHTPKPQKRSTYEQIVLNSLYEEPPEGFMKAIEYANRYISEEPSMPSGLIYAYLAAAYGQQYAHAMSENRSATDLEQIRGKAFNAAKTALQTSPEVKGLLRMLWDPNATKNKTDDDLEVFINDKEFKEIFS
jgi:hypothetical protein